jgi:hypothetical protein
MGIKFFVKKKDEPSYLVEWKSGYVQFWEEWSQFLRPKSYNWLNFRPIWFEVDYDKLVDEYLGVEFGLMGFNLRIHQFIRENEKGRELVKDFREFETTEKVHKKEIEKLKSEITKLRTKLRLRKH